MRATPALVLVAAILLISCGGGDAPPPPRTSEPAAVGDTIVIPRGQPVTIGVSAALSGDQTSLGKDIADAADLAVADFGGTLQDHPIRVTRVDDRCTDAEAAVAAARQLIQDATLAGVVGPMCTTGAQAADSIYERARTIHIAVSATRVELSAQGERYFFRTSWRDDAQALMQATYAFAAGAETAFVIDDGGPYGRGLAEAFAAAFEARGGRILARERIILGSTDFAGLARQAQAASAGVVVFEGLNPEGALLIRALREYGYSGTFIGPDSLLNSRDFLQPAGALAELAVITGGSAPDDAFNARFNERFQRLPATPFVLQSHDAVTALLTALRTVAVAESDGGLTIDRDQLAETLRTQRFAGLTGSITFDERGDRRGESARDVGLRIYRVMDGRFVPID